MIRADLQTLSEMRLPEARALLVAGEPCGAYYLAGYAVECALKSCIAKQTREGDFPDKKRALDAFDHSLQKLVTTAELKPVFDALQRSNAAFANNWGLVTEWAVEARYETRYIAQEAANLTEREPLDRWTIYSRSKPYIYRLLPA